VNNLGFRHESEPDRRSLQEAPAADSVRCTGSHCPVFGSGTDGAVDRGTRVLPVTTPATVVAVTFEDRSSHVRHQGGLAGVVVRRDARAVAVAHARQCRAVLEGVDAERQHDGTEADADEFEHGLDERLVRLLGGGDDDDGGHGCDDHDGRRRHRGGLIGRSQREHGGEYCDESECEQRDGCQHSAVDGCLHGGDLQGRLWVHPRLFPPGSPRRVITDMRSYGDE
jgi:hypothetical protein